MLNYNKFDDSRARTLKSDDTRRGIVVGRGGTNGTCYNNNPVDLTPGGNAQGVNRLSGQHYSNVIPSTAEQPCPALPAGTCSYRYDSTFTAFT